MRLKLKYYLGKNVREITGFNCSDDIKLNMSIVALLTVPFPEQVKTAERVQLDQIPLPDAPVATPTSKFI